MDDLIDLTLQEQCKGDTVLIEKVKNALASTGVYSTAIIDFGNYPIKTSINGSGTYVILDRKKGILTNYHVAKWFIEKKLSYIWVPYTDKQSKLLRFEAIIHLPYQEGNFDYTDLAFVLLSNEVANLVENELGKKFYDLDAIRIQYKQNGNFYRLKNALWLIHGNVFEGKKQINNRETIYLPNAGPYIVVPDLEKISSKICQYKTLSFVADFIDCPMNVQDKEKLPNYFGGMSGSALWNVIYDQNNGIEKIVLVGVMTIQDFPNQKLICLGPITVYESLYSVVELVYRS